MTGIYSRYLPILDLVPDGSRKNAEHVNPEIKNKPENSSGDVDLRDEIVSGKRLFYTLSSEQ